MNISDETLSAFLDAELNEVELEEVRCALETDDELVMRLADLAQADQWVVDNAATIDQTPIADELLQLAQTIDKKIANGQLTEQQPEQEHISTTNANNVVSLSRWKSLTNSVQKHYALAAGIAMAFGVGTVTMMQTEQSATITAGIAQVLDQVRSGEITTTEQGDTITANLSFTNQTGDYCRQFQQVGEQTASVNIACKENSQWQLKATEQVNVATNSQDYRVASNKAHLDSIIDTMIKGQAMDSKQEQQAISNNWTLTTDKLNQKNRGE